MNLLVALFSLACLIWLVPVIQQGRLLTVATLILGVGTVLGPAFFAIDGPIQFSLDRVLWIGMFGLAVLAWRLGHVHIPSLTRTDWVVVAMVGWYFMSCLRGGAAGLRVPPEARWLFFVLMPAGMYLFARIVNVRTWDVRWFLGGAVGLGLYLSITALLEVTGMHGLVFPRYIVDPQSWQFFGRGRGPLMNPSGNGFLISVSLVACALGLIHAGRRGKLLYSISLLIMLGGLSATFTRSTWLGGLGALATVAFFYAPRWVRVLGLASLVLLVGASALGVKDQLVRMKRDKNLTAADAEKSIKLRPLLAVVAFEMFKDRPIIGHGFGHYDQQKDRFHNNRSYGLPLEEARKYTQHNVFLAMLVETGLVGLALFLAWLAMLAGIGWTLARNTGDRPETRSIGLLLLGMMVAYFCNGMFHNILIIPMAQMFLFFVGGLAVTIHQRGLASGSVQGSPAQVSHSTALPAT